MWCPCVQRVCPCVICVEWRRARRFCSVSIQVVGVATGRVAKPMEVFAMAARWRCFCWSKSNGAVCWFNTVTADRRFDMDDCKGRDSCCCGSLARPTLTLLKPVLPFRPAWTQFHQLGRLHWRFQANLGCPCCCPQIESSLLVAVLCVFPLCIFDQWLINVNK